MIIGDVNVEKGRSLEAELAGYAIRRPFRAQSRIDDVFRTKFVKCDTTNWEDQLELFRAAASFSDDGRVSYVVAIAGIARADDVFSFSGTTPTPRIHACILRTRITPRPLADGNHQAMTSSPPNPT